MKQLLVSIQAMKGGAAGIPGVSQPLQRALELEVKHQADPTNGTLAFELASLYMHLGRTNQAFAVLDRLVGQPAADANALLSVAQVYATMGQGARLEKVLLSLTRVTPDNPEAWYDLASTEAVLGKPKEAMGYLTQAIQLSLQRMSTNLAATDLRRVAATNQAFASLRSLEEFQSLVKTN